MYQPITGASDDFQPPENFDQQIIVSSTFFCHSKSVVIFRIDKSQFSFLFSRFFDFFLYTTKKHLGKTGDFLPGILTNYGAKSSRGESPQDVACTNTQP